MATYRTIASTETDPDAPITSALMKALQSNVEAIREGDATAPKIQNNAVADGTFHGSKMQDGSIGSWKLYADANMTAFVGSRVASLGLTDVGAVVLAINNTGGTQSPGTSVSGGSLTLSAYGTLPGTWRTLCNHPNGVAQYVLRIA